MVHFSHQPTSASSPLSSDERRFWMLMAECERLLKEEASAIRKRDIPYLEAILIRKEAIVSAITVLETILDKKRPDAQESQFRLKNLQASHETNLAHIDALLKDLQAEKRQLSREKLQNKAILGTYYGDMTLPSPTLGTLGNA